MSLARDITTVGSGTLMSRLLAYLRDAWIAALLGAGPQSEAFFAVLQVVNFFRRLLSEGALNSAFVPLCLKLRGGEDGTAGGEKRHAYQGGATEYVFGVALRRNAHDTAASREGSGDVKIVLAIEGHAFNDFERRLDRVAEFHRDDSVIAGALEGFAYHVAKRCVVGGNARNSPQAGRPLQRSRRPS